MDDNVFSVRDFLDVFFRRWIIIVSFFAVTVIVVAGITFLMIPVYRATAVIMVDIESPNVLTTKGNVEIGSQGYYSYNTYREYYKSQINILTSYSLLKQVFDELNLKDSEEYIEEKEPIKKFLKSIKVSPVRDTRLIELQVYNTDSVLAAKIANFLSDLYVKQNLSYISKSEWLNLLKNEYLSLKTRLSEFSKIYKEKHPEIIRLKKEMAEVISNIERSKSSAFGVTDVPEEEKDEYWRALEGLKANNISIIEPATEPVVPVKPKKLINLLMAIFFGLIGGIGLAFFFEYQDATVKDMEDLEKISNWSFLGKVPNIPGPLKELHALNKTNDYISETFKAIRTRLSFSTTEQGNHIKKIIVSSLGPQEGKTTMTCNLAISIAQAKKRILLVDADMRKPRINNVFNAEKKEGLAAYLLGEKNFSELVQKTNIDNLSIIADKRSYPNTSELISTDMMKRFVEEAKNNFDFVIFDSPPIGVLTDAAVLSQLVDGIIIVLEGGKTPRKAVVRNQKFLHNSFVRVIGAIINRAYTTGSEGYYYSYDYSS